MSVIVCPSLEDFQSNIKGLCVLLYVIKVKEARVWSRLRVDVNLDLRHKFRQKAA